MSLLEVYKSLSVKRCHHCHEVFQGDALTLPLEYEKGVILEYQGAMCSWECVEGYRTQLFNNINSDTIFRNMLQLGCPVKVIPRPPYYMCIEYGGTINPKDFKKNTQFISTQTPTVYRSFKVTQANSF